MGSLGCAVPPRYFVRCRGSGKAGGRAGEDGTEAEAEAGRQAQGKGKREVVGRAWLLFSLGRGLEEAREGGRL